MGFRFKGVGWNEKRDGRGLAVGSFKEYSLQAPIGSY